MDLADAHAHLFAGGFFGRYGRACSGGDDLSIYESLRREHGIAAALVLGYEGDPRYRGNNEHLARIATGREWLIPLAFSLPQRPQIPPAPFAGIALFLSDTADAEAIAAWPRDLVKRMSEARLIVSVNAEPPAIARSGETLRRLEGCEILISHLGQPGTCEAIPSRQQATSLLAPLLALSDAAHIGVKLSGFYDVSSPPHAYPHASARPLVERLAEAFGAERLYWGSDFSPALDHVSFVQTIDAVGDLAWTQSEREAVMGGNLRRLAARVEPASPS